MARIQTQTKGRASATPGQRRSPLLYAVPVLALIIAVLIVMNSRSGTDSGVRPLAQLQTQDFHALAWSQTDSNTVFFGHHDGLLVSHDAGATWQPTSLQDADAMILGASAANTQRMYAAGHGIFYRSDDAGSTWTKVNTPLQGADIHGFAVSTTDANRLYAYVEGEGIRTSTDAGATWSTVLSGTPGPIRALVAGSEQTLYIGSIQGSIFRSDDGGKRWQRENLGSSDVTSLTVDQRSGDVYAGAVMSGMNHGLLYRRSSVTGQWASLPITGLGIPVAVTVSLQDGRTILLLTNTGAVYRSRDGGANWGR